MHKRKIIWIAWERQRRTLELSDALGVKLYILLSNNKALIRYTILSLRTMVTLLKERPAVLIVQNPSIILAFVASLLKPIFRYFLIVDRHSNFRFGKQQYDLLDRLFFLVSDFSIKKADITIVTNGNLRNLIEAKGGKGFVLPDKLPTPRVALSKDRDKRYSVTFICSYSSDEPYNEVIKAAALLDKNITVNITGDYKKISPYELQDLPENIVLTGYISDGEYDELLSLSDIIMDFTKHENCMVCGAYEAVSMGKPLITSGTNVLKEYFNQGTLHIDHSPQSICNAIMQVYNHYNEYCYGIKKLKDNIEKVWSVRFDELKALLSIEE